MFNIIYLVGMNLDRLSIYYDIESLTKVLVLKVNKRYAGIELFDVIRWS